MSPPGTVERIETLFATLSLSEKQQLAERLMKIARPILAPRAGTALSVVAQFLPKKREWTAKEIKREIANNGVVVSSREALNAIGYLVKTGRMTRLGYGHYLVNIEIGP